MDKHWRVKVGDFNLSRVMEPSRTASNLDANNPRWLAPEVITSQVTGRNLSVYSCNKAIVQPLNCAGDQARCKAQ